MTRFRTPLVVISLSTALLTLTAINFSTASPVPVALPTAEDTDVQPVEESMHEFMEYVFQPTYRRLKASMAAAPADNNGWKAVKSDALILAESCNLLLGRRPDEHGDDWVKFAVAARTSGSALYNAGRMKDFPAATEAWKTMLNDCNSCHRQFENGKHILQP